MTNAISIAQYGSSNPTFRNRIINGAMVIDQRNSGASKSYSAGAVTYAVDRFFLYPTGAAVTGQQVAGTNTGTGYAFRITGATGLTACNFSQRVENLNATDLNNVSVTISFKAYASSAISNLTVAVFCGTSANSGYGGGNNAISSVFSLASGLNTISQTLTMPSTASNGFEFAIGFGSGIANAVTVDISNVQLEAGSTATPFEYRQYGTELALCQRYLPTISYSGGANPYFGAGMAYGTTTAYYTVSFPVTPRVPPTGLVVSSASHFAGFLASTATSNATGVVFGGANNHSAFIQLTGMSGLSGGNASLIYMNNSAALIYFTGSEL